jgi:PKD repeat protein
MKRNICSAVIRRNFGVALAAALMTASACTMKDQKAPPLTGPSEFGTSITIQITPDVITQDGASQALITITARDANGQPVRNLALRADTFVNGSRTDFGTLSPRTVVTGADGKATLTFTAPPGVVGGSESIVDIAVTPIGTDVNNSTPRIASVRLVPQGVVLPPANLTAAFTVSPSAPVEDQPVLFDASTSVGAVTFQWNIDGTARSGQQVTHTFSEPGSYFVTLTIADQYGRSVSTTRTVTVSQGTAPTASFVFSPTDPITNQPVNFNASASTAAAGRRIVSYRWDFGNGIQQTTTTPLTSQSYSLPRTYTVTLTVVDDTGRESTTSNEVTVVSGS